MRYNSKSILVTVIFHILLIFILIFMGFKTPLPLPAEKGFIIDFGESAWGRGKVEPQKVIEKKVEPQSIPVKQVKETYSTQDFEDAPSVPVKKETKKTEQKKTTTKVDQTIKNIPEKKVEERKPNPLTMYKGAGSSNESAGEGDDSKDGNIGQSEGVNEGSHFVGKIGAMGIANVGDRNPSALPDPVYDFQKEGIVVVKVRVDRSGNVIFALPGVQGTTTMENYLLEAAKKAALSSKFKAKYDGKTYDEGTITYRFKLK